MKINELISSFEIWTTNEEDKLLESLVEPRPLKSFSERDQVVLQNLIRKSLVKRVGFNDPIVSINEKYF